ncbi:MAG: hypothetical protein WAN46_12000 [Gammaproteobacteria bacterium]|jgi:hypothetical protein
MACAALMAGPIPLLSAPLARAAEEQVQLMFMKTAEDLEANWPPERASETFKLAVRNDRSKESVLDATYELSPVREVCYDTAVEHVGCTRYHSATRPEFAATPRGG